VRIHVVQSGGLAGLRREHELDTEALPEEARQSLTKLVQGVAFFGLAPARVSKLPDMIQYRVRIEEGDRAHEVTFDDGISDTTLLELVELVAELAKARR
jgi:hypothetical protein